MIDLTQFLTPAGLAVLVMLLVQIAKGSLQTKLVPYFALIVGVILALVIGAVTGHVTNAADVVGTAIGGLVAGCLAIGGYELTLDKMLKPAGN